MSPFPAGHFYSPIVDTAYIREKEKRIWPQSPPDTPGVDFNEEGQKSFLLNEFPRFVGEFSYPADKKNVRSSSDFFINNGQFGGLDAVALFIMLRRFQPKKIIEVGSGFSSLLAADVNRRWFDNSIDFSCIEPYPRDFLKRGVPGVTQLVESKVEDVSLDFFSGLRENDILFIDSSHVSKTGSDVNYLYFEVIPRLAPGVIVHIHDIFFPYDYPKAWVLGENRSWNEQYLLRAMLMFTDVFEVLFGCAYAFYVLPRFVEQVCGKVIGGGSFWMRKRI